MRICALSWSTGRAHVWRIRLVVLTAVQVFAGATAPAATPATTRVRVPAGARLQVRLAESIDARLATAGDDFTARLETGLGLEGRPIVPVGSVVQGRVAEVRAGGPTASALKLELTALLLEGQALPLVTGSQSVAPPAAADPDAAAASHPGIQAGTLMEFRLLQPVDLRIPLP